MSDGAIPTVGFIHSAIVDIPQGNGESDRIGRKCTIKSIHVKGTIELPGKTDANSVSDVVVGMLVLDTQTNGAVFAMTDLLEIDNFRSFRNLANSNRFKILKKKVYTLKVGGAAPSGAAFIFGEDIRWVNINWNGSIQLEYDNSATTGVVTSMRSNNVYWVTQSKGGFCNSVIQCRIRYSDR